MSEHYRLVKSPKGWTCGCGKSVPAKTYRIQERRGIKTFDMYCLNCGERMLLSRKQWHRSRWVLVNKVLRRLRSHPKDRVVQRLS
jgi:ferredoxin-like protein FixX